MRVPVFSLRQRFVDTVIEILVMRENDMTSNIIKLNGVRCRIIKLFDRLTKPSGVISVDARPPGVSLASMIIHDGPF